MKPAIQKSTLHSPVVVVAIIAGILVESVEMTALMYIMLAVFGLWKLFGRNTITTSGN